MNDKNNSIAFQKLKPLYVNFLKNCNVENINALGNVIKGLDSDTVTSLQEYIILPFVVHLNTNLSEKITHRCVDYLTLIFKKIKLKHWKFFEDVFVILLSKISNMEDIGRASSVSEELKLSICENILSLICCSTEEILNEMYSLSFRPHLAHALFILNIMLREEKSKTLLKAVLRTMGGLTYNKKYIGDKYNMTELIASETLASCLPGLSISLQKVICGDEKQAHNLIIMALNILTELIILTVGDESYERNIAKDSCSEVYYFAYKSGNLSASSGSTLNERIPIVLKDESWFKSVSGNLEVLIKNMIACSVHSHWKVRLEFLVCSESLLCKCSKTLENCINILLPAIFGLSVDNHADVSSHASNILISLSNILQTISSTTLNAAVDDNIEKLVNMLIKQKISANDTKKLSILQSLLGYLDFSGLSLNKLIYSMNHLEKIILTLISLLEFNVSELNFIEEIPATDFDIADLPWPKKKFQFFENAEILSIICKICYSLGKIGNCHALIDYLLEKLSSNNLHTLQCIFIIGSIIKGLSMELDTSRKYSILINDVLEVLISPSLFDPPIHNYNRLNVQEPPLELNVSNNVLNNNKLQVCLILEVIANCAKCLNIDFRGNLKKILCPVMEKAGSSNYIISQCGRLCLYHVSQFCEYNSIQELISSNADYITNLILINIHQYLHKPEISLVLQVAMEHSDAEAVVLFRDLIFHILDLLDYNQGNAYPLMHVLLSVIVCVKKWFPPKKKLTRNDASPPNNTGKTLKTAITDYMTLKKMVLDAECTHLPEESDNGISNSDHKNSNERSVNVDDDCDMHEKEPKIPLHIDITREVFKRCIHFQSSENEYVRMLTLDTVEVCISVLCDYENELHPLVHEFWSPFLKRFTEDMFISKAFNVLLIIANKCGDFIRSRTFTDVMPKLVLFLQKECFKTSSPCHFKHYQYTKEHSLQILLLSEVGNLCSKLDIDDKDINAIATVCISYLKKGQPNVLQDAAAKSLKPLSSIDPDAVWFYWNVLYSNNEVLVPPQGDLLSLSFPYSDNSATSHAFDLLQ